MAYDGNGNYSLPMGYLASTGQAILASQHNPPLEDIAAALSQVLLRSGVAAMTGVFTTTFADDEAVVFSRGADWSLGTNAAGEFLTVQNDSVEAARTDPAGATMTAATSVVTREKGDARYLKIDGTTPITGDVNMSDNDIWRVARVGWGVDASGDWIQWLTTEGLVGEENGSFAFRIGSGTTTRIPSIHSNTTANPASVHVNSTGELLRSTSQRKNKDGFEPISGALEKVMSLNPVSYLSVLEADKGHGRFLGFVYEDVIAVVPEADAAGNYDERALIAILWAAVQRLSDRLHKLEA